MLVVDPTIDLAALDAMVSAEYGDHETLEFVPVGGDSWCFCARPWFISVRRDRAGHFPNTYEAAADLRDQGYEWVLAPVRGRLSGRAVNHAAGRPVVVTPHLNGQDIWDAAQTDEQLARLDAIVHALHDARTPIDLPRETFDLFYTAELEHGLAAALAGAAAAGPYGAAVTDLVRRKRDYINELERELNAVQATCRGLDLDFVLSHGEPANAFITEAGEVLLGDWSALAWAPRERDWRGLPDVGLQRPPGLRADVLRFYDLVWILSEIAEYVAQFTSPHVGDAMDVDKWDELLGFLLE